MKKYILLSIIILSTTGCDMAFTGNTETPAKTIADTLYIQSTDTWRLDHLTLTMQDNKEAEEIALCLSGDLMAPKALYARVRDDLAAIRGDYADLFAGKRTGQFLIPWAPGSVVISFAPDVALQVKNGEYHEWDFVNEKLGINKIDLYLIDKGWAVVYSGYRLNSRRMAEFYDSLPGVLYTEVNGRIYLDCPISYVFPRLSGNDLSYLVLAIAPNAEDDYDYEYLFFTMDGSVPTLVGVRDGRDADLPAWWDEAKKNMDAYHTF